MKVWTAPPNNTARTAKPPSMTQKIPAHMRALTRTAMTRMKDKIISLMMSLLDKSIKT